MNHKQKEKTQFAIERLRHGINTSNFSMSQYEILAQYGFMERSPNGFVALDPQVIQRRCKELVKVLENEINQ